MKKRGVIITSIVCGSLILLGCTTPTQPANIAKSLDMNLNNLTTTIKKLDSIDNSYLSNPDIYPITNTNSIKSANSQNKSTLKISTNDFNLYVPKIKNRNKIAIENENVINNEIINENSDPVINEDEINAGLEEDIANENYDTNIYYYNIKPIKYLPRYYSDFSYDKNVDYLTNYINKVRNLYAITSDAILANNQLNNFKNNIIVYCLEIKELNNSIKDGSFVPSSQQIAALNNYIDDIKITIKRIKKCNGDLSDEVSSINKTDVGGITTGIDVINSNYLTVLNHLDTRITYLKNALTTLEQIKQLLQESQEIIESTPESQTTIVENETINSITNDELNDNNLTSENEIINNENQIIPENIDENISTDISNENIVNENSKIEDDNNIKNIDTYLNTNNNLDTYKPKIEEVPENNTVTNIPENTTTVIPENSIVNNTVLNNNLIDENKINAPNGTFQNGIITQNNLNNGVNNGVNGNQSGYASSSQYIGNNNNFKNTNKNVDTYGYNTMIDMINNGTVNNGINTLSITETTKPSMVNSNYNCEENCIENNCLEDENCDCENCEDVVNNEETLIDCKNNNCVNQVTETAEKNLISTENVTPLNENYNAELL